MKDDATMFSSLKLSNLRGRKMGEGEPHLGPGPPHLDLTAPPTKRPVVTTTRRSHKCEYIINFQYPKFWIRTFVDASRHFQQYTAP